MDSETAEYILYKKHKNYENFDSMFDIVENYIRKHDRILTGGMAQDFIYRTIGERLYGDNEVPDYDFLTDNFPEDAYEIARELCEKGFENVSIVQGVHHTTLKVFVDNESAADVSYVPTNLYESIPTVTYKGIRCVSFIYTRIQMHESLSKLYHNPPMENLVGRFLKDTKRFNMFDELFPVETPPNKDLNGKILEIKFKDIDNMCVSGISAYAVMTEVFEKYIKEHDIDNGIPVPDYVKFDGLKIGDTCHFPIGNGPFRIFTRTKFSRGDKYAPLFDWTPANYRFKDKGVDWIVEEYTEGYISFNFVEMNKKKIRIANMNVLLKEFLIEYVMSKNKDYLLLYESLRKICVYMDSADPSEPDILDLPFFPSLHRFGGDNIRKKTVLKRNQFYDEDKDKWIIRQSNLKKEKGCEIRISPEVVKNILENNEMYFIDGRLIEKEKSIIVPKRK